MKIKPYIEKLNNSDAYKEFIKKYKDSFLIAGFFILDLENGKHVHQIDFYVPSQKKVAAFTLDGGVSVQLLDTFNAKVPEQLDIETKIDLDALEGILTDEMKNRSITEEIKKIIAILQNLDGKKIWNLSCVLSGMQILRAHIEDESKSVLKMETANMMDLIKKVSPEDMEKLRAQNAARKGQVSPQAPEVPVNTTAAPVELPPRDAKRQLERLNKLEEAIEQEKIELGKEIAKENVKKPKKKVKLSKQSSKKSSKIVKKKK